MNIEPVAYGARQSIFSWAWSNPFVTHSRIRNPVMTAVDIKLSILVNEPMPGLNVKFQVESQLRLRHRESIEELRKWI